MLYSSVAANYAHTYMYVCIIILNIKGMYTILYYIIVYLIIISN